MNKHEMKILSPHRCKASTFLKDKQKLFCIDFYYLHNICNQLFTSPSPNKQPQRKSLKKLTHSRPDETETAESKRSEPKGPTFAFSTLKPYLVRSNLIASLGPRRPTAYNIVEMR